MDEDSNEDVLTGLRNALLMLFAALGIALGAALILRDPEDAAVVAKLVEEATERKAVSPAEICINQYDAGGRWTRPTSLPSCAGAARVVPEHILSDPRGGR